MELVRIAGAPVTVTVVRKLLVNSSATTNKFDIAGHSRPLRVLGIMGGINTKAGGPTFSSPNIWISAKRAGIVMSAAFPVERPPTASELGIIERLRHENVSVHPFSFTSGPSSFKRWGVSLSFLIWLFRSARQFDIIQAHGAWMYSTLVAALAAKVSGRVFVLIPHEALTTFDVVKGSSGLRRNLKRLMRWFLYGVTDCVIFASPFEQRESIGQRRSVKNATIYHPVFDDIRPLPPFRRSAERNQKLRMGFLGRFDPKKNIELLIEVLALVPNVTLTVAGDGADPYRASLFALAEHQGVADRIEWLGFISGQQREAFFDTIDILAMPSANEGFGMVAAEALLHGVPVIASDVSGIAELIQRYDCGMVVRPNVAGVHSAIEALLANPARLEEFSRQAEVMVTKELSFSNYGARLATTYVDLIRTRR